MSIPFVFYTTEIGVDETLSSDPLLFTFGVGSLPGSLSCANVTIDDDSKFESNHSFIVELDNLEVSSVISADPLPVIDSPNSTIITILDNDGKYGILEVVLFCFQPLTSLLSTGTRQRVLLH